MERVYAFMDETGNFGFKFDESCTSAHFIITAIIVSEDIKYEITKSLGVL